MKEMLRLILTLSIICLISGAMLAKVNSMTLEPIAKASAAKLQSAIKNVLPQCDNQPDKNTCIVEHNGREWKFYVARNGKDYAGAAVETSSGNGYAGDISLMLGINADDKTESIAILEQKETPGLGANMTGKKFKSNFVEKDIKTTKWSVKKDGGDIDQITAATISSRAVSEAVKDAIDAYLANIDKIKQTGQ
jgi:electron transport complex protein RnfG